MMVYLIGAVARGHAVVSQFRISGIYSLAPVYSDLFETQSPLG